MGPLSTAFADDGTVQVFFAAFYAVLLLGLGRVGVYPGTRRSLMIPLVAFCAVVLASTLWSVDQPRTFSQATLLCLTAAAGLAVGRASTVPLQITAVFASQQLGVLISVIAVVRDWPDSRDFADRWAGIYFNRNSLGPVAALAIIGAVGCGYLLWTRRRSWSRAAGVAMGTLLGGAIAMDLIVLNNSGSLNPVLALAFVTVGTGALIILRQLRRGTGGAGRGSAAITLAGLSGLAAAGWSARTEILPWLGRDSDLDGRTPLWRYMWGLANERPLRGWGWLAVWRIVDTRRALLNDAHNGFLEVYLGAGLLGVVAVVAFCVVLLWQAACLAAARGGLYLWPFAVVLYALAVNQLESFIGANLLPWVLLTMAAATIAQWEPNAGPNAGATQEKPMVASSST
jgi:O-antigen ligase